MHARLEQNLMVTVENDRQHRKPRLLFLKSQESTGWKLPCHSVNAHEILNLSRSMINPELAEPESPSHGLLQVQLTLSRLDSEAGERQACLNPGNGINVEGVEQMNIGET
jgi:hypothetical protein